MNTSLFRTIRVSNSRFERDNLRVITVKSAHLGRRGDLSLYVPPGCPLDAPLVILLHGVYGSHWSWSLGGGAHLTANRLIEAGKMRPMLVAMPSDGLWGDGSGYLPHGSSDYERWIVEEVPAAVMEVMPNRKPGAPRFIAGLSMGGFGALRLGGAYASQFAGIAAHSAITHFEQMAAFVEEPLSTYRASPQNYSAADALIENKAMLPPLRFDCGTEDPLLEANRKLHEGLEAAGIPHTYEEFAGGHEWPYWETHIEESLLFFENIVRNR